MAMLFAESKPPEADPIHYAGTEVLNDNIRRRNETPSHVDAQLVLKVDLKTTTTSHQESICRASPSRTAGRVNVDNVRSLIR
jgi:hypothetical protein